MRVPAIGKKGRVNTVTGNHEVPINWGKILRASKCHRWIASIILSTKGIRVERYKV